MALKGSNFSAHHPVSTRKCPAQTGKCAYSSFNFSGKKLATPPPYHNLIPPRSPIVFSQFPLCLLYPLAGQKRDLLWCPRSSLYRGCPLQACCQVRMKFIWLPSELLRGWITHTAVGPDKDFGTACSCGLHFIRRCKNLILLESSVLCQIRWKMASRFKSYWEAWLTYAQMHTHRVCENLVS